MSHYAARTVNPYRGSTGALVMHPSPPRNSHMGPVNPPSPAESSCSSCDSSLPLNTPWSGTPTSSMTSLSTHPHHHSRSRRQSINDGVRIVEAPRVSSDGRPAPLIIHRQPPVPSPPQTSRSLNAYRTESRAHGTYHGENSPRTLIVPASSHSDRDRRRRDSMSGPLSARTLASHGYTRYYKSIDIHDDHEGNSEGGIGRGGRTRFPRKLVNKEAVEEMGLPWTEDSEGCVVVLRALNRTQIERLADLTEEIRRRRHSTGKAVSFQEKTIIHEAPPYAPEAPPLTDRPHAPLAPDAMARLNSDFSSHHISKTVTTTTTTTSPTFGPTKFIGLPGSSQEKLARAEEKAARAEDKAARLEERAEVTRRAKDEHEAFKARAKAQEKQRKVEETLLKEKVRMEGREMSERTLRFQRSDGRGNVVILK
ncbi:hypothetical protein L873DRAFT_1674942 [Choiromyces venosus 120613-1]|uniref:DUF8035 domain-containing protein n=1 Tax=Choiromyces venosus 120613-1 TaxID=1336337 RepID=A0A3N4JUM9_9PEZI|nr:hypothetical protein L873DRAFT_1674942 [Choiromyces venosus 120613-1]